VTTPAAIYSSSAPYRSLLATAAPKRAESGSNPARDIASDNYLTFFEEI
jgi:hypothetical protein